MIATHAGTSVHGFAIGVVMLAIVAATASGQDRADALALYRNSEYQAAVDVTRQELEENPSNLDSFVVMGWSQIGLGRYSDALESANAALAVARYDQRVIEIAGEALYYLGRLQDALARFEEYAALAPEGARIEQVYAFMGEILLELEEFARADIAFSRALYALPNSTDWWARLGYARELAGAYESALLAYDRALSLDPAFGDASRGRSRVLELVAR